MIIITTAIAVKPIHTIKESLWNRNVKHIEKLCHKQTIQVLFINTSFIFIPWYENYHHNDTI
jgi:hypothetical protein